jgi:hypothetical protein
MFNELYTNLSNNTNDIDTELAKDEYTSLTRENKDFIKNIIQAKRNANVATAAATGTGT